MTQSQLNKLVNKWQSILRLEHWDLIVKFSPSMDSGMLGNCLLWANKYCAEITIALPEVIKAESDMSVEHVLVHELIHVLLDPNQLWPKDPATDSAEGRFYEKSVDRLTQILMEAYGKTTSTH